jgi:hypothetical protein
VAAEGFMGVDVATGTAPPALPAAAWNTETKQNNVLVSKEVGAEWK